MWPLHFKEFEEAEKKVIISTDCPGVEEMHHTWDCERIRARDEYKQFGDSFIGLQTGDSYNYFMNLVITQLGEQRLIRPFNMDKKHMWKEYEKGYFRLIEFMERKGFGTKEQIKALMMQTEKADRKRANGGEVDFEDFLPSA